MERSRVTKWSWLLILDDYWRCIPLALCNCRSSRIEQKLTTQCDCWVLHSKFFLWIGIALEANTSICRYLLNLKQFDGLSFFLLQDFIFREATSVHLEVTSSVTSPFREYHILLVPTRIKYAQRGSKEAPTSRWKGYTARGNIYYTGRTE